MAKEETGLKLLEIKYEREIGEKENFGRVLVEEALNASKVTKEKKCKVTIVFRHKTFKGSEFTHTFIPGLGKGQDIKKLLGGLNQEELTEIIFSLAEID